MGKGCEYALNALDIFIEKRIDLIIEDLNKKLSGQIIEVIDTSAKI